MLHLMKPLHLLT